MHRMNCELCHKASSGYFKLRNSSSSNWLGPRQLADSRAHS